MLPGLPGRRPEDQAERDITEDSTYPADIVPLDLSMVEKFLQPRNPPLSILIRVMVVDDRSSVDRMLGIIIDEISYRDAQVLEGSFRA